jgi:hypothetical protein
MSCEWVCNQLMKKERSWILEEAMRAHVVEDGGVCFLEVIVLASEIDAWEWIARWKLGFELGGEFVLTGEMGKGYKDAAVASTE